MNFDRLYIVVATLFILLAVGFFCRKVKIIDDVASKKLSRLILTIGQPAMLAGSLASAEYNEDTLKTALIMTGLGFVFHAFLAVIAFTFALPLKKNLDEQKLSEFGLMFTNCAFIGFPIFEALLPGRGQFMASFLCVSFNILIWTWGLVIIGRGRNDIKLTFKKALVNFGTIPCLVGFGIFLLKNPAVGFTFDPCEFAVGIKRSYKIRNAELHYRQNFIFDTQSILITFIQERQINRSFCQ